MDILDVILAKKLSGSGGTTVIGGSGDIIQDPDDPNGGMVVDNDGVAVDNTLTMAGYAADAKAVGDRLSAVGGGKTELIYESGNVIKHNGQSVNFKFIIDELKTNPRFTYLLYGDRAYLPSLIEDDDQGIHYIYFESTMIDGGMSKNAVIVIYSNDGVGISGINTQNVANENYNNKVAAITDRNKSDVNSYTSVKAVVDYVEPIKDDIAKLAGKTSEVIEYLQVGETPQVGCYPITTKGFWNNDDYNHIICQCADGDEYKATATCIGNVVLAMFYSGTPSAATFISAFSGALSGYESYTNQVVNVPDGCRYVVFNTVKNRDFAVSKKHVTTVVSGGAVGEIMESIDKLETYISNNTPPVYYKINGEQIDVVSKYGESKDIVVRLNKHGQNNIFDFASLSQVSNNSAAPTKDISAATTIVGFGTDIHAPFEFTAVNNADGDGTANGYTGGNHAYNGVKTGRTVSVGFYPDGKKVESGEGYCSFVEIRWANRVQPYNTVKADGTGRECLEERHILRFDGSTWWDDVELVPLEDIKMVVWYALQMYGTNSVYPKIRYIGGANRGELTAMSATKCGNNKANGFVIYGDTHKCECVIDKTIDMGDRSMYGDGDNTIFTTTVGKVYHYIVKGAHPMGAGEIYYLRGYYRFSPV